MLCNKVRQSAQSLFPVVDAVFLRCALADDAEGSGLVSNPAARSSMTINRSIVTWYTNAADAAGSTLVAKKNKVCGFMMWTYKWISFKKFSNAADSAPLGTAWTGASSLVVLPGTTSLFSVDFTSFGGV